MKNKVISKVLASALSITASRLQTLLLRDDLTEKRRLRLTHVLEVVQLLQTLLPFITSVD